MLTARDIADTLGDIIEDDITIEVSADGKEVYVSLYPALEGDVSLLKPLFDKQGLHIEDAEIEKRWRILLVNIDNS